MAAWIILGIIGVLALIVMGYDAAVWLYEKYSHYHIGRWENREAWRAAVAGVCRRWAVKTPVLRLKKECRYLLFDRLLGQAGKAMVQSWQKAGCVIGLEDADPNTCKATLTSVCAQLIDQNGRWRTLPAKVDYAMMGYALLRGADDPASIRPAMDEMIGCIEANLCGDGLVSYSMGPESKRRYVDTLGFICPFLALYGAEYQKPEYISMAVRQLLAYRERGFYAGLPVHCFETDGDIPIGVIGWGRGTGWYALGLIDTIKELPDGPERERLLTIADELAETVAGYERPDCGFSPILQAFNRYDSSATAMLGYFLAEYGAAASKPRYRETAERCLHKLLKCTKINGVLDQCQGDTVDLGIFSDRFEEMPFAQGMALRLHSALYGR